MSTLTQTQSEIAELALAISYRPTAELTPDAKSARQHSKSQIKKLARSIREFGFAMPVLVDRDGGVIAGHARLMAAQQVGMPTVPTICLEHLSADQIAVYKTADNRLSELSTWDDKLLAESLQILTLLNLDFSLELTGFDMGEIDLRIEGLQIVPEKGRADPGDTVPEAAGSAVTTVGDLWLLGRHRVFCGSALEAESYARLMDGLKAVMVSTDPPYNVPIRGHVSGLGRIQHRDTMVDAMDDVLTLEPVHVILATAAESAGGVAGAKLLREKLLAKTGGQIGVTLGADAILAGLHRYGGIARIGLVTPYMPTGDEQARRFFEESGFTVAGVKGLKCRSPVLIAHTPEATIRDAIKEVDGPDIDAVVIVGTNLPMARVAAMSEFWLGKPVVALNTATYWHALRTCGVDDKIPGFGRLLGEF